MPQTIAPVAAPVMPPSPSAHSQTTTADGDFAAIFQGQLPGKQAFSQKNKQMAENSQAAQDPSQTGIGGTGGAVALSNFQEAFAGGQGALASGQSPAVFPTELQQQFQQAPMAGDAADGSTPDISSLEQPLPQFSPSTRFTPNKNLTNREAATAQTGQRGGSFLMSELRRLVESHDPRATVHFERGGKASLQDMPALAVAESAPAATAAAENAAATIMAPIVAAPKTKTLHSIAAPLSTAGENAQAASGKPAADKREIVAAAPANDKRQAAGQANRDGKTAERLPPAASGHAAATASKDEPVSGQVAQAAASVATTGSVASAAKPGQPPSADVAMMQQVIDHLRDLPRPLPNRISLQLHPAELGQLKINLTMQEGVIRASLVTQTVQAQEILEKHMPKLRALLERQGFALEDVHITREESGPIVDPAFLGQEYSSPRGGHGQAKGKQTTDGEQGGFAQALAQAGSDKEANGFNIHA